MTTAGSLTPLTSSGAGAAGTDPDVLALDGLRVTYGGVVALDDVTFSVGPGVTGLIGPNGAGKSSLVDALSGYVRTAAGTVRFQGRDITRQPPHLRARAGLVRTFQSTELFGDLTVEENVLVAAQDAGLVRALRDLVLPAVPPDRDAVDLAMSVCHLEDVAGRYPSQLSHGRRKLVGVARALARRPRLVLLDEPAAGLDSDESAELGESLRQLPDHGINVLLIDHDMTLVLGVCEHVLVLDFGVLVAAGTPEQIRKDSRVIDAYLGQH
jgi:branched-chain amino acid transport system ATP-binding protein